jgi:hypothetical protein
LSLATGQTVPETFLLVIAYEDDMLIFFLSMNVLWSEDIVQVSVFRTCRHNGGIADADISPRN